MTILALGEALIEFVRVSDSDVSTAPTAPDTGNSNADISARPLYRQGFGGDTSNAIIAAARQGATTGYITAVGDDPMGKELLNLWHKENVDVTAVRQHATDPTGAYFVHPQASGHQFSYARRGSAASHYHEDYLPLDAIAKAKILHTSALTMAISESMRDAAMHACQKAQQNSTLVSFDTNLRLNLWDLDTARHAIEQILPFVDIVFPSEDEAALLCGSDSPLDAINYFNQYNPKLIVMTRGADGADIYSQSDHLNFPAQPSQPVDSTGAGDSFAGSFLAHYLETGDTEFAGNCAAITAAIAVSGYGAIAPLPDRATVLARLKQ